MQASKEVWAKLFGSVDTREKFQDKRLELAEHEWRRLETNNSLECRNCHSFESMDFTRQSPRAQNAHQRFLATGEKTCIRLRSMQATRCRRISRLRWRHGSFRQPEGPI